ncbi:hypothetical protein EDB19DRAFT_1725991 [Suillus lakei]|nr:hypothetical protein EDB19DRAFT_1725991 [Suillus lakei]
MAMLALARFPIRSAAFLTCLGLPRFVLITQVTVDQTMRKDSLGRNDAVQYTPSTKNIPSLKIFSLPQTFLYGFSTADARTHGNYSACCLIARVSCN